MKKIYIILLSFLLGIIFFISFTIISDKKIYFSLNGNSSVELNIGEQYNDEGFEAKYCSKYFKLFCKDLSEDIKITKRDVEEQSKYFINYSLKYRNTSKVLTREVKFVDKDSPVIELKDSKVSYCPNSNYIEDGYTAYDNVDGDITDKVVSTIKDNKIYYTVSDSSGNKKIVYREINYKDEEAPTITLNGGNTTYVFLNQEYKDRGFSAFDNCEGDVTNRVNINSNVDTSKVGDYNVEYSINDSSNNKTIVNRKVVVYDDISQIPKNGKIVYLTFDDGPGIYTEEILNILNKYNVKATFFVTNQFSKYQYLIKKEYESGHTIAVHTYSHNYKTIYNSVDDYINDFNNMNEIIYEQTGIYSKIFRFPGGSSNTISKFNKGIMTDLVNKMNELGYYYFDWNVDSTDTSTKDSNQIYENVIKEIALRDYSVVLMHDIKKANVESVEKIISYGLENGYTFLPLDESSPIVHHSVNN